MRIIVLSTSKKTSGLLKEIVNENKAIKYDWVEDAKDLEYYLDIRNYDFILLNSEEIDVDNELLEDLVDLTVISKNMQILYVKARSKGKLNNLERAKLLKKGIIFSIDEDDYTKEYIETLLNTSINVSKNYSVIREGKLLVDTIDNAIFYDDRVIILEGKPFEVFAFLLKRKNEIITREELLHSLWIDPELISPNIIDVCVNMIRQKIDKPLNISTIETVRRRGFRFVLKD